MSAELSHSDDVLILQTISSRAGRGGDVEGGKTTFGRLLRRWLHHAFMRLFMFSYNSALSVAKGLGPARRSRSAPNATAQRVLLTGRFESDNWIRSHLEPLSLSEWCGEIVMVSTNPVPPISKVRGAYPPRWLIWMFGRTLARLLVFAVLAFREKPNIIGGFCIRPNAMAATLLARLTGAKSLYFCVGGPTEVLDGGIWNESGPFLRMETPDHVVEKQFFRAITECDLVVTMGTRAAAFLADKGVDTLIRVNPGGIDFGRFRPTEQEVRSDLVFVGRLAAVKRVDILLKAIKLAGEKLGRVNATIVGDGPLRKPLEEMARSLGISDSVKFVGLRKDVGQWLSRSRIFILTSRTEGLSLSLMEATMCGLPSIVPRVGDLPDLVEDGVNGYLVTGRGPRDFAARIIELLADDEKRSMFSRAARDSAERFTVEAAVRRWDGVLGKHLRN